MEQTLAQYDAVIASCRQLFADKTKDYGTSWRILRPSSLTDQMYIKAKRIRQIETTGSQMIEDSIAGEYTGLVNYGLMAILQLQLPQMERLELPSEEVLQYYDTEVGITRDLMVAKNSDYGEVWREMRLSSMTDLILAKLLRIKQIEDNAGQTIVSEGLSSNYRDIINYAIFCLIRLQENSIS